MTRHMRMKKTLRSPVRHGKARKARRFRRQRREMADLLRMAGAGWRQAG
jgi:hypothetical protein